jgi:hypothetical protein
VTERLRGQHREIELRLDRLAAALAGSEPAAIRESFAEAWHLLARHYEFEERTLFAASDPALAVFVRKLAGQHQEARELAGHIESGAEGDELLRLARRFLAIAQHNLIEEERDLFPLC